MAITESIENSEETVIGHSRLHTGGVAGDQLCSIIERIERLEEERAELSTDIKDVFAEAKANGFDIKAIRKIIRLRKQDAAERDEEETVLELYMRAIGMLPNDDSE